MMCGKSMASTLMIILTLADLFGAPIIQERMRYKREQEGENQMVLESSGFLKEVWTSNLVGSPIWVDLLNSWLFERKAKGLIFRLFDFPKSVLEKGSIWSVNNRNRRWSNRANSVSLGNRVSSTLVNRIEKRRETL